MKLDLYEQLKRKAHYGQQVEEKMIERTFIAQKTREYFIRKYEGRCFRRRVTPASH